jgi:hypothetical protein
MADGRDYGYFWNDDGSGDRTYNADSFEYWLKKFFTTGVFAGDLQVTAGGSYTVNVATGYANVNGKVKDFYNAETFTVPSANSTYPRIDTIVVRRDDTNKIISLQYVTGTYSGQNPTPTAPARSGAIYELVLAEIYVGAGATEILQRDITDKRADKTVCGIVTGTVEEVDFSQFASQFNSYYNEFKSGKQADFGAWFQEMKDQLSTDAAGHLQLEIDGHTSQIQTLENEIDSLDSSKADKSNLASISITGTTNNTGSMITQGTFFYKSGTLVRAKADIANGATLTANTNYEVITAGALNALGQPKKLTVTGTGVAQNATRIGDLVFFTIEANLTNADNGYVLASGLPTPYQQVFASFVTNTNKAVPCYISSVTNGQLLIWYPDAPITGRVDGQLVYLAKN